MVMFFLGCSENHQKADNNKIGENIYKSNSEIVKNKKSFNEAMCSPCHGNDWSKKALGHSRIVSKMTQAEIAVSLIGYKKGTYGGKMKDLMQGQIEMYSEDELRIFSKIIAEKK